MIDFKAVPLVQLGLIGRADLTLLKNMSGPKSDSPKDGYRTY
jgi:hypothetical protein